MEVNFDAVVRLTEALLPLLRESAPSAIVNVASTAGRVARGGSGAYSASKFALAGWTDVAPLEEMPHGVHVGMVLPGFIATEGFPQAELTGQAPRTRWTVSTPEKAAEAIVDAGLRRRRRSATCRGRTGSSPCLRIALPRLMRGAAQSRRRERLVTRTGADEKG